MSWKRMIFGEKTPDKNDPRYKERYEKEVEAGRKTARFLKIDRLSAKIQTFASKWPRTFLSIVATLLIFCFCYNGYILLQIFSRPNRTVTATEIQRQCLDKRKTEKLETLRPEKATPMNVKSNEDQTINAQTEPSDQVTADVDALQNLSEVNTSQEEDSQENATDKEMVGSNDELESSPSENNPKESFQQPYEFEDYR